MGGIRGPIYDGYRDGVLRRFLTRKWLGAFVLAILAAIACYHLGQWQYGRHLYKAERNARLDANYRAEPVPLASVMTSSPLPLARQWTRVTARGEYTTRHPIYVRNRPNLGSTGFELVSPFRLDTGQVVLVDRGWVEASSSGADVLPAAPAPPTETVTLVGWALPGEASKGRKLPAGQLASINLPEAARATGEDLLGGYVRLQEERSASGDVAPAPTPLDPPDRSLGPHQAYAYQWWLTMPLGLVLIWFGIRRELRMEAEDVAGDGAAKSPHRPKKVRVWDEEDG